MSVLPVRLTMWLCAVAAIALALSSVMSVHRARHVRTVMATGTETMAQIAGAASGIREGWGGKYWVDLVWKDSDGVEHKAQRWVSKVLARQIQVESQETPLSLMIKYLPGEEECGPVIIRQATDNQELNRTQFFTSVAGAIVFALAALALFWRTRRAV
jgi:hypothetical protein